MATNWGQKIKDWKKLFSSVAVNSCENKVTRINNFILLFCLSIRVSLNLVVLLNVKHVQKIEPEKK